MTTSKHVIVFVNAKITELEKHLFKFVQKYCDYKISSIFVIYKITEQYTSCGDIIEISKLSCATHSLGL